MTGSSPTNAPKGLWDHAQPRIDAHDADRGRTLLPYYRVMAVVTGIFLAFATVELILHYATDVATPGYSAVWTVHGWLFFVYVIVTALMGLRLRWPLARYGLVMLAGTIPTMSFVAERVVTRETRAAGVAQSEPVRD